MSNGTADRTPYSLYGIEDLYLMDSTVHFNSAVSDVYRLHSQTISGIYTTSSSPRNKIYTSKGSMLSFKKGESDYGDVTGYTILSQVDSSSEYGAYAFGGFGLLTSTLYKNFGITIDGSFEVDFTAFRALIDKIGGVDITLTADEAKIVGRGTTEGVNHLDGHGALTYARIRKIGTDFARTSRQRTVLMAVYGKVKGMQLTEIISLINEALPYLTTDMSNSDIISLATKLFPLITKAQINSYYVPPDGMYENKYIRSMAILYPNLAAIKQILRNEYLPLSDNAKIATQ